MIQKITGIQDVLDISPTVLASMMANEYMHEIPTSCESIEDLEVINVLLPTIVNQYAFLSSLQSYLKARQRQEKRTGNKESYEDLIDKNAIVFNTMEALKMQQKTLSRMVTIKTTINEELKMSESY